MNGLIKSRAVQLRSACRSTAAPTPQAVAQATPQVDERVERMAELEQQLGEAQAELERIRRSIAQGEQAAFERGLVQGEAAAKAGFRADTDRRSAALSAGVDRACALFQEQLAAPLQALSLDLAQAALERIVDDRSHYRDLILATVERHTRHLARGSVLAVSVSAADFPDAGAPSLPGPAALPAQRLTIDPALAAGSCLVRLELGRLDLGLGAQKQRLADAFDRLREAE